MVVVVAAGEFDAEVEEAPRAREIEIRDPDGSRVRDAHGSWTGATRNFLEPRYRGSSTSENAPFQANS